jgi:hypothetical protein
MESESLFYRAALESQLGHLKDRLERPEGNHWRKMGIWARDFDLWLERAKPWIPCASRLISLRVEQIVKGYRPDGRSEEDRSRFRDLLQEAERHLQDPNGAIQVLDLGTSPKASECPEPVEVGDFRPISDEYNALLPTGLVEIPEDFQPEGNPPIHFRYLIPN